MEKRVFSGIKPSGNLHLGNYIGAMKQWVESQNEGFNIFCVVDLHAITVSQDPVELKKNSYDLAAMLLAVGIDPEKSLLFVQSHNPDHANLAWILNCYLSMGQMNRMTQYKEKSDGKDTVSVGLFDYPALMAADILLYKTTHVPVGEDQKQHVELTRDVAERMNKKYGDLFTLPIATIPKVGGRVMSLSNPTKKMSKSVDDPSGTIGLLDSLDDVKKKVMSAVTDSDSKIVYDPEKKPGISNLLEMYCQISGVEMNAAQSQFSGVSYGAFKTEVSQVISTFLGEIQQKFHEKRNISDLDVVLNEGAQKAYDISHPILKEMYSRIGFA
jgi:tryptophanyl-tRNA synthetase